MTTPRSSQTGETPLTRDLLYAIRYYLGRRRTQFVLAGLVIMAVLAFNWSWLVAIGVAPLLITVLPCLAMCGLGLCMNMRTGGSSSTDPKTDRRVDPAHDEAADNVGALSPGRPTSLAAEKRDDDH
jgi:hypothetical protein